MNISSGNARTSVLAIAVVSHGLLDTVGDNAQFLVVEHVIDEQSTLTSLEEPCIIQHIFIRPTDEP